MAFRSFSSTSTFKTAMPREPKPSHVLGSGRIVAAGGGNVTRVVAPSMYVVPSAGPVESASASSLGTEASHTSSSLIYMGAKLGDEHKAASNPGGTGWRQPGLFKGTFTGPHTDVLSLPPTRDGVLDDLDDLKVYEPPTTVTTSDYRALVKAHNAMVRSAPKAVTFRRMTNQHADRAMRKRHGVATTEVLDQCSFHRDRSSLLPHMWHANKTRLGGTLQGAHGELLKGAHGNTPLYWL